MSATARHDPIEIARALLRCPSVTPLEGGALSLIQNLLEPAGFTCHRLSMREPGTPDVENLYARFGTEGPNLCFAGHTDVVPPGDEAAWSHKPFAAEIAGGILYGRGAVDMKGSIACFLAAALDLGEIRFRDAELCCRLRLFQIMEYADESQCLAEHLSS